MCGMDSRPCWSVASPHQETRRVWVWLDLFQVLFKVVTAESETQPFYPEMCLIEAAIKCPGDTQGRSVSWLKFCFFIFLPPCFAKAFLRPNDICPYLGTSRLAGWDFVPFAQARKPRYREVL